MVDGGFGGFTVSNIITGLIGIFVAITLFGIFLPLIGDAGDSLNQAVGSTTSNLFVAGGIIGTLLLLGLLFFVLRESGVMKK